MIKAKVEHGFFDKKENEPRMVGDMFWVDNRRAAVLKRKKLISYEEVKEDDKPADE